MTVDPRLTKAEAMLDLAREQIQRMTPSIGDPDPTTITLKHLADALAALTAVLNDGRK
jgi:hypothetical protein